MKVTRDVGQITCWFSSKETASNTNNLGCNLRKSFLRKQYLLKKSHLGNEISNLIDTKLRLPIDNKQFRRSKVNTDKVIVFNKIAKSSFSNFSNSVNVNSTYFKQSSSVKLSQEKKERDTATTTIILDLEKYNLNMLKLEAIWLFICENNLRITNVTSWRRFFETDIKSDKKSLLLYLELKEEKFIYKMILHIVMSAKLTSLFFRRFFGGKQNFKLDECYMMQHLKLHILSKSANDVQISSKCNSHEHIEI
ncbi:hypothetical protein BpHYR1_025004 [Brachionus plicatilis]|uniref:Uncharacterized protein n=1 Tax=Brachionus plicatilis TaxID=10195 RepID=A0A3M7RYV7_BRAPC|nr:hypothetical protein BpHYR1_025004 [Brachionus plicatilis]